jgi:hypothetical protein
MCLRGGAQRAYIFQLIRHLGKFEIERFVEEAQLER